MALWVRLYSNVIPVRWETFSFSALYQPKLIQSSFCCVVNRALLKVLSKTWTGEFKINLQEKKCKLNAPVTERLRNFFFSFKLNTLINQ